MKYLDKYPSWSPSKTPYQPDNDSVERWIKFIENKYQIKDYNGMKIIEIDYKSYYLSGPLFNKNRITQKIFFDITNDESLSESQIHIPSLRKAIKNWIDLNSKPLKESFKNTDEEILMFFTDYYDENPDNFKIENVLLYDNKEVRKVTPYLKDASKYKRAKIVTVKVDKPNGPLHGMSNFSTSLDTLQNILSDLERFYDMAGEEVNYKIINDYTGISIQFLVVGETVSDDESKVKLVDDLLKDFKELFKKRGFRPSIKGNWVEIKTSGKKSYSAYGDYSVDLRSIMNKIKNGQIDLQNLPRESYRDLVEWFNKVTSNRLTIEVLGGDHQFVIKLKNQ